MCIYVWKAALNSSNYSDCMLCLVASIQLDLISGCNTKYSLSLMCFEYLPI